jgi:mannan endo-1,4-beta-mannosidase
VDIVGRDIYNQSAASAMSDEYSALRDRFPDKLITLSECGNVAGIADQLSQGAGWLWFMPWYDYNRTQNPNSAAYNETAHEQASIAWWNSAFSDVRVLSRDEMPDFK